MGPQAGRAACLSSVARPGCPHKARAATQAIRCRRPMCTVNTAAEHKVVFAGRGECFQIAHRGNRRGVFSSTGPPSRAATFPGGSVDERKGDPGSGRSAEAAHAPLGAPVC